MFLHMYIEMEQLNEWMADGGNRDSYYWSGNLDKQKEEAKIIHVILNWSCRHQLNFFFLLYIIQMVHVELFLTCVYIHGKGIIFHCASISLFIKWNKEKFDQKSNCEKGHEAN